MALIPFSRRRAPARRGGRDSFLDFREEMDRLFDDFWGDFSAPARTFAGETGFAAWPSIDVVETGGEVIVTADLPGLSEDDIDIELRDGALVIRGEKSLEDDREETTRRVSERFYGRFERRIPLAGEVDPETVSADFSNGELTIRVPAPETARGKARKIRIGK